MTEVGEEEWIKKASIYTQNPSNVRLVIETKRGNRPIGIINLHAIDWVNRHATTGSMIGEAKYRGKGYATDAKMILLEYAFDTLGMHKIISRADARNVKSIEYSKRCGYVVEATLKEEIFHAGKWEDVVTLACFYDGWKKAKAKLGN
jgi:RimJ/RimL family protein N-acetyltransferase